jgi:hypothetical protein
LTNSLLAGNINFKETFLGEFMEEELMQKLQSAFESDHYFITVSYIDKEDGGKMQRYWKTIDFKTEDAARVLKDFTKEFAAKAMTELRSAVAVRSKS